MLRIISVLIKTNKNSKSLKWKWKQTTRLHTHEQQWENLWWICLEREGERERIQASKCLGNEKCWTYFDDIRPPTRYHTCRYAGASGRAGGRCGHNCCRWIMSWWEILMMEHVLSVVKFQSWYWIAVRIQWFHFEKRIHCFGEFWLPIGLLLFQMFNIENNFRFNLYLELMQFNSIWVLLLILLHCCYKFWVSDFLLFIFWF